MGASAGGGAPPSRPSTGGFGGFNMSAMRPPPSGGFGGFNMSAMRPTQSGGFGGFNMAAMRPNPGGFFRGPTPTPMPMPTQRGFMSRPPPQMMPPNQVGMGIASPGFNPAMFNQAPSQPDPKALEVQAAMMGDAMSGAAQMPNSMRAQLASNARNQGTVGFGTAVNQGAMNPAMFNRGPSQGMPTQSSMGARPSLFGGSRGPSLGARRFAEGGKTSSVVDFGAMAAAPGSIPQPNRRGDPLPTSPVFQPISQDPNVMTDQRTGRIPYQPRYIDYATGLDATPEARRFVSNYKPQIPTPDRPGSMGGSRFERPVAYNPPSAEQQLLNKAFSVFKDKRTPEQKSADLTKSIQQRNLTEAQYNMMLADPGTYLPYLKSVQAGNAPSTIYQPDTSVSYMTAAQRDAYNKKMLKELDEMIRPITVFPVQDYGGA